MWCDRFERIGMGFHPNLIDFHYRRACHRTPHCRRLQSHSHQPLLIRRDFADRMSHRCIATPPVDSAARVEANDIALF